MSIALVLPSVQQNANARLFGTDLSNILKGKNAEANHLRIQKKSTDTIPTVKVPQRSPKRILFKDEMITNKEDDIGHATQEFPNQIERSLEQMVQKLISDDDTEPKAIKKYSRDFMLQFQNIKTKPPGLQLVPEITRKPGTDDPIPLQQIWVPKPVIEVKKKPAKPKEEDDHRLSQRQKQIDFGKNTEGYNRYRELIPKKKRAREDPQTPDKSQKCSKRSWDGQIKKWRRLLHKYDSNPEEPILLESEDDESVEEQVISILNDLSLKAEDMLIESNSNNTN